MSVDREYAPRISTRFEDSSARQVTGDLKDAGIPGTAAIDDTNVFEKAPRAEVQGLLQNLNDVLPGARRLLRAALELNAPGDSGIFATFENVKKGVGAEASSTPLADQSKSFEELGPTNTYPIGAARDTIEFGATDEPGVVSQSSESAVDAQTRAGFANQVRQFQQALQAQGPAMNQQDAVDLLTVIRQLGEAFFQQTQNSVTKQEFEREKIALRRLIESKGK